MASFLLISQEKKAQWFSSYLPILLLWTAEVVANLVSYFKELLMIRHISYRAVFVSFIVYGILWIKLCIPFPVQDYWSANI